MTNGAIELNGVSKAYGAHQALRDVSLTIPSGQHTAILGPSGSGKSTLLKLVAGLEAPDAGSIKIDGQIMSQAGSTRAPPHERHLALVFQDLALWPNLTVAQNVLLGLSGRGLSGSDARQRMAAALTTCRIDGLAKRKPGEISGGEQQRAALARAIAVRPRYLLLDEPFSGVDLATKHVILCEIIELAANHQITAILVTHDPAEAAGLCSHAYVLENHRIGDSGMLPALIHSSNSPLLVSFRRILACVVSPTGACH